MEPRIENDLVSIYGSHLDPQLLRRFLACLDEIISAHPDELFIKTRNRNDAPLNYISRYFNIEYVDIRNSVCAGCVENDPIRGPIPVIRFRNEIPVMRSIEAQWTLPYRKPNWTYIIISIETIEPIRIALQQQYDWFADAYVHE